MRPLTVIAAVLVLACGNDSSGPTRRRVGLDEMLGRWSFQVQRNTDCPGGSDIGSIVVNLSGGPGDVFLRGSAFGPGLGSNWAHSDGLAGEVTGFVSLDLPGGMALHLSIPRPNDSEPTQVAGLLGTVDEGLHFTGKLLDPDDVGFVNLGPIFSLVSCTYSAEGSHSLRGSR